MSSPQASSELLQLLQDLSLVSQHTLPSARLVSSLGQRVDFARAISLSDFLAGLPKLKRQDSLASEDERLAQAQERFLSVRGEMMAYIAQSLDPETKSAIKLPKPDADDGGLAGYQRFYSLMQSEMETRLIGLSRYVRENLSQHSSEFHQLASLDQQLQELTSSYSRKALAAIPKLLATHFHALEAYKSSGRHRFLADMHKLLLAEWDTRLQPTQGLLEALIVREEHNNHD